MIEIGTLKELNVKPGDVVEWCGTQLRTKDYIEYTIWKIIDGVYYHREYDYTRNLAETDPFRIISRANTPKLWRDMTDAEKGALLLAYHEGKEVQGTRLDIPDDWRPTAIGLDNHTYRIRPELKIEIIAEEVELNGKDIVLEYTIVDGIMDKSTIKVQK